MKNYDEMAESVFRRRDEYVFARKKKRKAALISIISLCIALAVGIGIWQNGNNEASPLSKWPEKIIYTESSEEEMAYVPRWEEMTITGQYSTVEYNSVDYSTRNTEISPDMLGEKLGVFTARGFDEYADEIRYRDVTVHKLKDFTDKCIIAIQFEENGKYYVCTSPFYSPATLGDFINDLNLDETVSFGTVTYHYDAWEGKKYISERIEFEDVTDQAIWEMLLSDTGIENIYDPESPSFSPTVISISVDIPLLGYENIGLWITEDGHIHTNILDTGKEFYIGKEKAEEFLNYINENCHGYRIVYKSPKGEDIKAEEQETPWWSGIFGESSESVSSVAKNITE